MNLKDLSLEEIIEKIKNKEISSKQVFDYFLKRIKKYDSKIHSFNSINETGLNENDNILAGVPIGVKDLYCEKGIKTTGASKMLENFIPPYNSTIIKKLNEAGMSSIGKVNCDEFAMGSSGGNSAFGPTINPWGINRIPGGTSSGSAASVSAGLIPASIGTDTGGSLRQPGFMCGVVGFRPSYGRNSRYGVMPMASSFDCPGTITKTVKDAALLYEIMNGEDERDSTSIKGKDIINKKIRETKSLKGFKIGVPKEYFGEGLDKGVEETVKKAIEDMKNMGAEIKEINLKMTKYAIAAYYILVPAEVSTNLGRLDGLRYGYNSKKPYNDLDELYSNNRGEGLGIEVQRRTLVGSFVLSAGFYDSYFLKAAKVRTLIVEDFKKAFEEVDMIACPTSPSVAWKIGKNIDDPLKDYLADAFTVPSALAGLPGISIPCGFSKSEDEEKEELPVGIQLIGPYLGEERIFEIANVFEKTTNWREKMVPKGFED